MWLCGRVVVEEEDEGVGAGADGGDEEVPDTEMELGTLGALAAR